MNKTCWTNKDKPISDIFLLINTHGHTSDGQQAKTFIHQLVCSIEDLPSTIANRNRLQERMKMLSTQLDDDALFSNSEHFNVIAL